MAVGTTMDQGAAHPGKRSLVVCVKPADDTRDTAHSIVALRLELARARRPCGLKRRFNKVLTSKLPPDEWSSGVLSGFA